MIGTHLAAIGRSQKVRFFVAKIDKDDLDFLAGLLETGKVKSVIDKRFELSQAADALELLGRGPCPREGHCHHVSVDDDRLRDLTLELVQVESPTGDTFDVAWLYAQRLEEHGLEVEVLDDRFPTTPIVVGRLERRARPDDRLQRPPRHGADPARVAAARRRHDLRTRLRRHEGRARVCGGGGAGARASAGRSRASS